MKFSSFVPVASLAALLAFPIASAGAAEFTVDMQNTGDKGSMVFVPDLVRAAPGDTINFHPVDAGHNAETIKGMFPEGAEPFKSAPSKDFSVTLTVEGVYGIRCTPHYGLGMVMLVTVGKPNNLEAAEHAKNPPKAKKRFEPLFAELNAE